MGRPSKNVETARLNLEMAATLKRRLEEIRDETQADSLGEVIRRAVSTYDFLLGERNGGYKLILRGPKGDRELVLI